MSGFWDQLVAFLLMLWGSAQVKFMLGHIAVNVVAAVAAAIVAKEFFWGRIGEFLYRKILPFGMVYIVAVAVGDAAGMAWLATAVWGILEVNLFGDLADSLAKLGVPLPGGLGLREPADTVTITAIEIEPPLPELASPADEALAEATAAYEIETGEAPPHATPSEK
jgi:hypothetical protein